MPIYSYICRRCNIEERRFVKESHLIPFCEKCKSPMRKIWKKCPETKITEKRNHLKNTNVQVGIEEVTKKRSKEYFMEHCIDEAMEKIAKNCGDKEAKAMAYRNGWLDPLTGKKKTTGDLK